MQEFLFQLGSFVNATAMGVLAGLMLQPVFGKKGKFAAVLLGVTAIATAYLLTGNGGWMIGPVSVVQWGYALSLSSLAIILWRYLATPPGEA